MGWAWLDPEYRKLDGRAFAGHAGALTVLDEGMPALELAMKKLLADQSVRKLWDVEDLWTIVLSLLAASVNNPRLNLVDATSKIAKPKQARVLAALANVSWASEPQQIGGLSIAYLETASDVVALAKLLHLESEDSQAFVDFAQQLFREFGSCVVATATSSRQGSLAYIDFQRALDDVVGLTLMLSNQLDQNGIFSLRGAVNKPGLRGITLDRGALGALLAKKGAGELASRTLTLSEWGPQNRYGWHSADPLPMAALLRDQAELIGELARAEDPIAQRLKVAARWYARAFWADAHDDAALAVSVAMDALLTGKEAVPGAVSKGRYALLERRVEQRRERFARYDQVYGVRSAIAHGGDASKLLEKIGGARSMMRDARWVAGQLISLRNLVAPRTESELRDLWSDIQWGTFPWVISDSH